MTPKIAGRGAGTGLFAACLDEVRDGLLPEPPVTITMTDEERAAAMAAVHAATCRRRGVPPLPQWFLVLPVEEQLRRWQEAMERGDFEPCPEARGRVCDYFEPDIVGFGPTGSGLPHDLREPDRVGYGWATAFRGQPRLAVRQGRPVLRGPGLGGGGPACGRQGGSCRDPV